MHRGTATVTPPAPRRAAWSGALTARLAALIPARRRATALLVIKALHTVIFASVGAAIGLFVLDGLRRRPGRRAAGALGIVLAESAVYLSNNQVCPLTPLATELGAARGSVADIFLPDWFARRIPLLGTSALLVGLVLNLRAWQDRRAGRDA
ncbi:MAG: hypothetical protein ACRDGV_05720 [Candidatus Limnocylindria bacterium]